MFIYLPVFPSSVSGGLNSDSNTWAAEAAGSVCTEPAGLAREGRQPRGVEGSASEPSCRRHLPPSCIGSMAYSHPKFAIGDRELVHEKRLNDGHRVTSLFAVPECAHVLAAFPVRDRIARIWIILIAKEPLTLQPFASPRISRAFLKAASKASHCPGRILPQTIRMCMSVPPLVRCFAYVCRKRQLDIFRLADWLDCRH